jgi:hypothetical protein
VRAFWLAVRICQGYSSGPVDASQMFLAFIERRLPLVCLNPGCCRIAAGPSIGMCHLRTTEALNVFHACGEVGLGEPAMRTLCCYAVILRRRWMTRRCSGTGSFEKRGQ